jgi:uncharacterized protein (DUF4415 family)
MHEENLTPHYSRSLTAKELAERPDSEIDLSDMPELTDEWFAGARIVYPHERKQQMTVRLDADVVDFFKAKGKGYQTRMNEVLRTYVEAMWKP